MTTRDLNGEIVATCCTADDPEGIDRWNTLLELTEEHFAVEFLTDADGNPAYDARGCRRYRAVLPDAAVPLAKRTIGDVKGTEPGDPMDEILSKLPATSNRRARAETLLRAGLTARQVREKLGCSRATVATARAAILQHHNELIARGELPSPLPVSVTNPLSLPRPDMRLGSGTSPYERRAQDLGVTVAEAMALAREARARTKFKEHTEELTRNTAPQGAGARVAEAFAWAREERQEAEEAREGEDDVASET